MASVQADKETYSLGETIVIRKKNKFVRLGSVFRRTIHRADFLRGLQDGNLRSKPHVEGEHSL